MSTVHGLFQRQAAGGGRDAVALAHGGREISYGMLDRASGRVASQLRRAGVRAGDLVAVCMDRTPELIASLLGVLVAGAAYVPVDRDDPEERLRHIAAESGIGIFLADDRGWRPPGAAAARVLAPGAASGLWEDGAGDPPPAASGGGRDAAYVVYTSGSTGRPKGVVMEHASLVNLLRWHDRTRPGSCQMRTLQACALSFDFAFHEIFSTLCFGGTLVLPDGAARHNPFALARFVAEHAIERLFLPVTTLSHVAEAAGQESLRLPVREVITTGERLRITPALVRLFGGTGARLHNHYGATEFQDATVHTLSGDPDGWPVLVPIGRPIEGVTVHVLDERLEPVPDGTPGELWIGGAGVARGYLRRPDLTAQRFLPNPFGGGRLYRTGDLARLGPAGAFEHLGRADDQVKIRGVRVELGEIEAVLGAHPSVEEAAVLAQDVQGEQRLVAYVVLREGVARQDAERDLRAHLARHVPDHLRPDVYGLLDAMPLTASGKTDRRKLRPPDRLQRPAARTRAETERLLAAVWREVLGRDAVGVGDNFFDLGGTSSSLVRVQRRLGERLGVECSTVDLFRHPTIRALAAHLVRPAEREPERRARPRTSPAAGVAVIGMAGRFPGARDLDAFWRNLRAGVESVTRLAAAEVEQTDAELLANPAYVRAGALLSGIESFDAAFFDISAREAATMDPQHRVALECAWEAFEDAGYDPTAFAGAVGVYLGSSLSTYLVNNVSPHYGYAAGRPFIEADLQQFQVKLGNDRNYLPARVSYKLDLRGPSVAVQTACSTSLVAVHLACRSLLGGECDLALAGGVSIIVPQRGGYLFEEGMIRSPDGHCRAFDARAAGTLFGSGGGVVLLKRLEDALADADPIVAVVRGSAVNNDGSDKVGFTAPSVARQADVIAGALAAADVDPETVRYVEAHGTATALGDPIEVAALNQAFGAASRRPLPRRHCAIGSVKTNIGHLDEAAGIASFVKTALALRHGEIPPSLHFERPNPRIDFAAGPFFVNASLREWPADEGLRRAGVSSFGMGGTNCHVVLEEAPPSAEPAGPPPAGPHLLALSARGPDALRELAGRYAAHLAGRPGQRLADVCFTAGAGRHHFEHRLAVVADSPVQARERLEAWLARPAGTTAAPPGTRKIAFLFAGQGSQHADMGGQLAESEPAFREALDRCDAVLRPLLGRPLLDLLASDLDDTAVAQPALFAVEYALSQLWRSWGVQPDVVIGHSAGELVAACVAGVLSLEDGLRLAAERGRLMQALPAGGRMVAVLADEATVAAIVLAHAAEVAIAAVNGDRSVVVSGAGAAVAAVCASLAARGIERRELAVSHAFHSPLMEPAVEAFARAAAEVAWTPPQLPIVSTVTGALIGEDIARAEHWVEHVRRPVRFAAGIEAVARLGVDAFVELSPAPTLLPLARQQLPRDAGVFAPSLRPGRERDQLLRSARDLYLAGVAIDWSGLYRPRDHRRVRLPTYPWRRQRHWIDAPPPAPAHAGSHPLLGERIELADSDEVRFQARAGARELPWLRDHRVFQTMVMPGVAYVETAAAAARAAYGDRAVELRDLLVHRAMPFAGEDASRLTQVVLRPGPDGGHAFQLFSRPDPGTAWSLHAAGQVAPGDPPDAGELAGLRARITEEVPAGAIYQGERERDIDLGPAFQVTERLWRDGLECLSRIVLRPEAAYVLHPVLLEACLLALTVAYPERHGRRTYVPVGFERVRIGRSGPVVEAWCHARLRPAAGDDPETLAGDVRLLDPDGRAVVTMDGVLLKRADRRAMLGADDAWRGWLYRTQWAEAAPPSPRPGRSLVVADGVVGAALAQAGGVDLALAPAADDPVAAAEARCAHLLRLVQAPTADGGGPTRLCVVTRGAQPAGGAVRDVAQAALWGLARVVAIEHPELDCRLIDLDPDAPLADQVEPLLAEIAASGDDQVALRGGVRHVARLVRASPTDSGGRALPASGTYLVTGGLGGLGLEVARLLVERGARHLALAGRRPPGEVELRALRGLEESGATVVTFPADMADRRQVARLLDQVAVHPALPPLRGVLHLAGLIDDGVLRLQTPDRFARVLGPKAGGAWALHELTAGIELDCFVLFSSSAAVLGAGGQANYAAANAFLDGLASYRRGLGLPALSIQWGSWAEVGMSARLGLDRELARTGEGVIPRAAGRDALAALLGAPPAGGVVAVLPADWPRYLAGRPAPSALLDGLQPRAAAPVVNGGAFRPRLDAAPASRRRAMLEEHVREQLARILGDDVVVEPDAGFFSLGMSSLTSIELRNRLQASLGCRLGPTLAFDHPTLAALVEHLGDDVLRLPAPEASDVARRLAEKLGLADDG